MTLTKYLTNTILHFPRSKMSVQISHKLDLDPELPEKYKEVALKQGEDPNTFKMHLDELRKMIYGELRLILFF